MQQYSTSTGMVLDEGIKVFVYSGMNDYVCNYIGGAEWTKATKWRNQVASYLYNGVTRIVIDRRQWYGSMVISAATKAQNTVRGEK